MRFAKNILLIHDDVTKWKHFPRNWPFVRGIHRSPVNSPHKGQWRGALMISLICVWINDWLTNREAGDLRRYRAHYDVIVMQWFIGSRGRHMVLWNLVNIDSDNFLLSDDIKQLLKLMLTYRVMWHSHRGSFKGNDSDTHPENLIGNYTMQITVIHPKGHWVKVTLNRRTVIQCKDTSKSKYINCLVEHGKNSIANALQSCTKQSICLSWAHSLTAAYLSAYIRHEQPLPWSVYSPWTLFTKVD